MGTVQAIMRKTRGQRRGFGGDRNGRPFPQPSVLQASSRALVHSIGDEAYRVGRRLGDDSVTEVEDVTGARPGASEHVVHAPREELAGGQQVQWIEVPLHG